MRYRSRLLLVATALLSCAGLAPDATAQSDRTGIVGDSGTLSINVLPREADIRLDGVPIGTAQEVLARAVAVVPGQRVLEISAPGFIASRMRVLAEPDWATSVWLQLVPDRGK